MLTEYKILINNIENKKFKGKLDIGKSFLAYVEDEENEEEFLKNKAIELMPELKDVDFSLKPAWELEKEFNYYSDDRFTDKIYVDVEYDFVETEYEPLEEVDFALFHKRLGFINTVSFTPEMFESWQEMERYIIKEYNPVVITPISIYNHSGIALQKGVLSGWDCSQIGYMFISKKVAKEAGLTKEEAEEILNNTIEEYAAFLADEQYVIKIYDLTQVYEEDIEPIESINVLGYYHLQEVLQNELNEFLPKRLEFKKGELKYPEELIRI